MKKKIFSKTCLTLVTILSFIACSPEDGLDGSDGINGTNGINGLNSLINTIIEQPGENCANGGYKIEVGLDFNINELLDANEVTSIEFICNLEDLDDVFLSYASLISQSGVENPIGVVLENSLELNISWVRESQGKYLGTLDKTIDIDKTIIFYTTPTTHTGVRGELVGGTQIKMELQNGINVFDDNFVNLSFELKQYE